MYLRSSKESNCARWTNEVIDFIAKDNTVEYVVVSYRLYSWLYGEQSNIYPNLPNSVSEEEREKRWRSYVTSLEYLASTGKKVILILQAPELPTTMEKLIIRGSYLHGQLNGVKRSWWELRSKLLKNRLNDIPKEVYVFDPANIFCDIENC
jgi:hypothetical protein